MIQQQTLEGTGEELQAHLKQHPRDRFRLILLSTTKEHPEQSMEAGLRRGMFPTTSGADRRGFQGSRMAR